MDVEWITMKKIVNIFSFSFSFLVTFETVILEQLPASEARIFTT